MKVTDRHLLHNCTSVYLQNTFRGGNTSSHHHLCCTHKCSYLWIPLLTSFHLQYISDLNISHVILQHVPSGTHIAYCTQEMDYFSAIICNCFILFFEESLICGLNNKNSKIPTWRNLHALQLFVSISVRTNNIMSGHVDGQPASGQRTHY